MAGLRPRGDGDRDHERWHVFPALGEKPVQRPGDRGEDHIVHRCSVVVGEANDRGQVRSHRTQSAVRPVGRVGEHGAPGSKRRHTSINALPRANPNGKRPPSERGSRGVKARRERRCGAGKPETGKDGARQ